MKYIRTKDGRIFYAKKKNEKDVKLANDNLHWEAIPKGCNDYFTLDYKDDEIIAQSDNPEELCDEFVWVTPEGEHRIKPKTGDGLWYLCCDYKNGHQLYGGIWTDKGLSYAMKMNERRKWKLL